MPLYHISKYALRKSTNHAQPDQEEHTQPIDFRALYPPIMIAHHLPQDVHQVTAPRYNPIIRIPAD